jgi:hypothetical protein
VTVAQTSSATSRRRVSTQSSPGSGRPPGSPHRVPSLLTSTTRPAVRQTAAELCAVPAAGAHAARCPEGLAGTGGAGAADRHAWTVHPGRGFGRTAERAGRVDPAATPTRPTHAARVGRDVAGQFSLDDGDVDPQVKQDPPGPRPWVEGEDEQQVLARTAWVLRPRRSRIAAATPSVSSPASRWWLPTSAAPSSRARSCARSRQACSRGCSRTCGSSTGAGDRSVNRLRAACLVTPRRMADARRPTLPRIEISYPPRWTTGPRQRTGRRAQTRAPSSTARA